MKSQYSSTPSANITPLSLAEKGGNTCRGQAQIPQIPHCSATMHSVM